MHIMNQLFNELEKEGIKYCHFKSNQHLKASFDNNTDFDVLIDHNKKNKVELILLKYNCKKFESVGIGIYPGVEDWYVFDYQTGEIFHLHLHYQLATGKQYVKEYVLPWTELVLNTAVKDKEYKTYISNPNVEIIILLTRMIVKSKLKDKLKSFFGFYKTHKSLQVEYSYLKEKIDINEVAKFSQLMYTKKTADIIMNLIKYNLLSSSNFRKLEKGVRKDLKNDKRMTQIKAFTKALYYKSIRFIQRVERKLGRFNITRKTTKSGGRMICFIGVDGSGKSTLTTEINQWLIKGKIENKRVYMGAGDGEKPILATFIGYFKKRLINKPKDNKKVSKLHHVKHEPISLTKQPVKYLKRFIRSIELFSVVKGNRKKIINMNKYRLNGGVSIIDRYPQLQQPGINDGLKLGDFSKILNNSYVEKIEKREKDLLQIVEEIYPDLIFRLNITTEVSMQRKPEENTDFEYLDRKIKLMSQLEFNKSKLCEIDAEKNYGEVLLGIKRIIWNEF